MGEGAHLGAGCVINQRIAIGRMTIIGAGAVVTRDVPEEIVVAGVPVRVMRDIAET